jgi:hypothetical protein
MSDKPHFIDECPPEPMPPLARMKADLVELELCIQAARACLQMVILQGVNRR